MLAPLKVACQAMSGKGHGIEEACKAAALKEVGDVTLPVGDAQGAGAFVTDLGSDSRAVQAERVSESCQNAREAHARRPPLVFDVAVPLSAQPGQEVKAMGPAGPVVLRLQADAVPGGSVRFAMKPKPRYLVEVPKNAGSGWTIRFQVNGGEEVQVLVPPGVSPGDTFEVTPPALLVQVPEDSKPGDFVKFIHAVSEDGDTCSGRTECFRAVVPDGLAPKQYFVALIPPPGQQAAPEPWKGQAAQEPRRWQDLDSQGQTTLAMTADIVSIFE